MEDMVFFEGTEKLTETRWSPDSHKIVHEGLRYLYIAFIASAAGIHIRKNGDGLTSVLKLYCPGQRVFQSQNASETKDY